MWSDNDAFSVRLSTIERLAKDPKPSFIYALKISDGLEPVSAYLIPLLDNELAMVLRRLRAETAKGRVKINNLRITFPVPPERIMDPSGEALRTALIAACGPDPEVAIRTKAEQLKSLGFEVRPYQVKTTFVLEDANEIADVLLGLKSVRLEDFQGFETRFGIRLPIPAASGPGLMHIQPGAADSCQVVVRGSSYAFPGSISAEVFVPAAPLDRSVVKYLIRSVLFDIEVSQRGVHFATKPENLKSVRLQLSEWINFFRMMTIFSGGCATLDIIPARLPHATMKAKLEAFAGQEQSAGILSAFESVDTLFRLAGVEAGPCCSMRSSLQPADT